MAKAKATKAKATKVPAVKFLSLPAGVVKDVRLDSLTFDRRLQHRGKLTDPATVTEYAKRDEENAKAGLPTILPAAKAVYEKGTPKTKDHPAVPDRYWVWNGFQRGAAWEANGRETVPVEVTPGTFADAYFLSLSANSDESILPRTGDDARRAVWALLDSPEAMEVCRVTLSKLGKGQGGLTEVMARACGVAAGTVQNALVDKGKMVRGDQIVNRPVRVTSDPPEVVKADSELALPKADAAPPPAEVSEKDKAKANAAAYAAMLDANFADRVGECARLVRRIGTLLSTLIVDKARGQIVRDMLRAQGMSVSDDFDTRRAEQGKDFAPWAEIQELWPVSVRLGGFFLDLRKAHEAAIEAEAAAEEAKANPPAPVENATAAGVNPEAEPATPSAAPSENGKPKKGTAAAALAEVRAEGAVDPKPKRKGKGKEAAE